MLSIEIILAAFGGGLLGALWGALPSFIFCGLLALIGNAIAAAGGGGEVLGLAFGEYFGPHIGFAGGVAAAAFAAKSGEMENGTDITAHLVKFGKPMILIVGGLFGIVGCLIHYLFANVLGLGNLTNFDTIALTVATSGIIVRFLFGKSGLTGASEEGRKYFPDGNSMVFDAVVGIGLGLIAAFVAMKTGLGSLPFAVAAFSLMFIHCGQPFIGTHHTVNCAAVAALASGSLYVGAIFGIIASILGTVYNSVFNSKCDTHIDPPALTIATLTLVIALVF